MSVNVWVSVYTEGVWQSGGKGKPVGLSLVPGISWQSSSRLPAEDYTWEEGLQGGAPFRNELQTTELVHDAPLPHQRPFWSSHYRSRVLASTGVSIPGPAGGDGRGGEGSMGVARRA